MYVTSNPKSHCKVRDVVNVVYRMTHPPPQPALEIGAVCNFQLRKFQALSFFQEYKKIKDDVIAHEQQVLRSIGFNVNVELPYNYLLNYSKSMQGLFI